LSCRGIEVSFQKKIQSQANNLFPSVGATFPLVVCLTKYSNLSPWVA
jgi:hypothetical protein